MKILPLFGWLALNVIAVESASRLKPLSGDIDHIEILEIQTGHNRVQRSVGDCHFPPTLRFQFKVKDEKIVINLEKNEYLSRRVPLYVTTNGQTYEEDIQDENNFAAYQDVTRGSAMLVSCQEDGTFRLHGSFRHEGVMYHMSHSGVAEPSPVHFIQRNHRNTDRYRNDFVIPPVSVRDELRNSGRNSRQKRANIPDGNIVELLFSIDKNFYDYFKDFQGGDDTAAKLAIEQYAALLANEIDLLYCSVDMVDPSLSIKIYLVGVEIPVNGSDVSWSTNSQAVLNGVTYIDASRILPRVESWYRGESGLPQHDHMMALSTLDMADLSSNPIYTGVEGIAYIGTVCSSTLKISFTEVDGSRVADTAAHELGHGLGSNHDGFQDSSACSPLAKNIMTSVGSTTTNITYAEAQWTFSRCSVAAFKSFIDGLGTNCMKDHAFTGEKFEALQAKSLPGTAYSLDQQCQLYNGQWSSSCDNILSESDCYRGYHCSTSATLPGGCSTSYYPLYPLAGTPCGAPEDNKWCYRGLCVARSTETTSTTTSTSATTSPSTTSTKRSSTSSTSLTTICTTSSTSATSPTTSTVISNSTTSPTTSTTTSDSTESPTTATTTSNSTISPSTSTNTSTTSTTTSYSTTSPTNTTITSTLTTSPSTSTKTLTTSPTTSTETSTTTPTSSTTTSPSTTTPNPCNERQKCCKRVNRKKLCCKGSQCCSNTWAAGTSCYSSCCGTPVDTTTTATTSPSPPTATTESSSATTPNPCNERQKCCKRVNRKKLCCKGSQCCSNTWAAGTSCYSSCCDTSVNTTTTLPTITTTTTAPCYRGKCCGKIKRGKKFKRVCCKGKKCCKQSWAADSVCTKTCC